jgi:hypothetical protein
MCTSVRPVVSTRAGQPAAPTEVTLTVYTSDGTTVVGTFLLRANVATGSTTAAAPGTPVDSAA